MNPRRKYVVSNTLTNSTWTNTTVISGDVAAGIRDLYILTTTVRERALRDGFEDVARERVPETIREGSQFRGLCPASAACMRLRLE
jgi:N-acetylglutamate synthase-like GNAT family acetyltransferase